MSMPDWWVNWSGAFFVIGVFVLLGMIGAIVFAISTLRSVQAKLDKTIARAEAIADRLEKAAKSAQSTVDSVGGSARSMASSVESVVLSGAKKIEPYIEIMAIAMTGIKLYQQFAGARSKRKAERADREEDAEDD